MSSPSSGSTAASGQAVRSATVAALARRDVGEAELGAVGDA
jgi:hypothetical protein